MATNTDDNGKWGGLQADGTYTTTTTSIQQKIVEDYMNAKTSAMPWGQSQSILGGLGSGGMNTAGTAAPTRPSWSLEQRLAMRMNVGHIGALPFDYIQPVLNEKGDNVIVFAIKDGQHMTFEDDRHLFPTDSLVGKLNMLR